MPEHGSTSSGVTYRWIEKGTVVAPCDGCHRRVFPDRARLQLHDKKGSDRPGGKGSRSTYLCQKCAWKRHQLQPPKTYQSKTQSRTVSDNDEQGSLW